MKTYFYSMDRDGTLHLIEYNVTQVKYNDRLLWFAENIGAKIADINFPHYPHYRLYGCFKELSLNKIKKLNKTFKRDFWYEN